MVVSMIVHVIISHDTTQEGLLWSCGLQPG